MSVYSHFQKMLEKSTCCEIAEIVSNLQSQLIPTDPEACSPYVVRECVLKVESNRYLVRSALQKCIRRGDVQRSMDYASYLYHYNSSKVFRDLAIIAIEDVGIGSPDAVYLAMYMDKYSKERHAYGDPHLLLMTVVIGLALAPYKSRACCELSLGLDLLSHRMMIGAENTTCLLPADSDLKFKSDPRFARILEVVPLYEELLKARGKFPGYLKDEKYLSLLSDAYSEVLPPILHRMCVLAMDRAHDSMFLAAFPVCFLFTAALANQSVDLLPDAFPPESYINGVPCCAFDMHTLPGKQAIKAFHTSVKKSVLIFNDLDPLFVVKTLGSIIFTEEGGLCNNQIDFACLKEFQDLFFHLGFGVPASYRDDLKIIVRDHLSVLHAKRQWASRI